MLARLAHATGTPLRLAAPGITGVDLGGIVANVCRAQRRRPPLTLASTLPPSARRVNGMGFRLVSGGSGALQRSYCRYRDAAESRRFAWYVDSSLPRPRE